MTDGRRGRSEAALGMRWRSRLRAAAAALLAASAVALTAAAPGAVASGPCGDVSTRPWCNSALTPDDRASLLLAALTQDEKLSLLAGASSDHTGQTAAVPRLGLRTAYITDDGVAVKQGSSTALPIPLAIAAAFDPSMATLAAGVVGGEARAKGNDVILGPTVNIMRTPLGGRTFEAYGEDPYLVASTAVAWIESAQSQGVIAEVKHFCCNNQEGQLGLIGEKNYSSSDLDERTLREIYLPAFEAAVKTAHAGMVMCAYNRVNDDWACENRHLLTDILKREWGFAGLVGSDWQAYGNTTVAEMQNGLDLEMPTAMTYSPTLVSAALTGGLVTEPEVDDHVHRLLRTLFAFGFFDRAPYVNDDAQIDKAGHAAVAQRIEEGAITLLKNDRILPLEASRLHSIALIGPQANRFENGNGTVDVKPFTSTTPLQAITQRAGPNVHVAYDDGSDPARAASVAHSADVAIVFASDSEGEYMEKACASVDCTNGGRTGSQDSLIATIAAANPHTVVVLETGDPVLTPWRGDVKGLLEAWYPGEEGGTALARVLFGDADPGGRLPATFPASEADLPTAGDPTKYPGVTDVYYKEGIDVGYRWYDAHDIAPAFPFGYGLSYTSFDYRNLRLTPTPGAAQVANVSVDVVNTGRRAGSDVPQLYIGDPSFTGEPPKQLKGYQKVSLGPGRRQRLSFAIDSRALSVWNVGANTWQVSPGCYEVMIGHDSRWIVQVATLAVGGAFCPGAVQATGASTPRACTSGRAFVVHLYGVSARDVRRVSVYVDGRRQRVLYGRRGTVRVSLVGRTRGIARVRLEIRTAVGRTLVDNRVYRTCSARRRR